LEIDDTLYDIDLELLNKENLTELEELLKQYEHMIAVGDSQVSEDIPTPLTPNSKTPSMAILSPSDSKYQVAMSVPKHMDKRETPHQLQKSASMMNVVAQSFNPAQMGKDSPTSPHSSLRMNPKMPFLAKLFEVVSDVTMIDHPICKECAHKQIKALETQVAEAMKENASYKSFFKKIESDSDKMVSEAQMDSEIKNLELEEAQLLEELQKIEEERTGLKVEMEGLKGEASKLKEIEERYWTNYNTFQDDLKGFQEESDSVKMKLQNAKNTLERLKVTNIYNDTFHIWYDGHFGTINNFRLGRLPSQPVDWNEINAAWGQSVQLLHTISKKLNFNFSSYRLVPLGSNSKIEKVNENTTYELYGSSDISLGRLFWYRRFDNGMTAFLQCLKEIGDHAESQDKNFQLPYKIDKDKIGDMSIRIQFNTEETWTKSLKYMLTSLKFLLVWVAKQ